MKGTALADVALRKKLFDGGKAAIDASRDPMIVFARLVDSDARDVRKRYEDEIEGPIAAALDHGVITIRNAKITGPSTNLAVT